LRADVPGSMRAWILVMGAHWAGPVWEGLFDSVRTGQTSFDQVQGKGIFDFFADHPQEGALFNESMTSFSAPEIGAIMQAYDFSGIGTLVDIAGGHGSFLKAILEKYPAMNGVLADLPAVIAGATGLPSRCRTVPINFF